MNLYETLIMSGLATFYWAESFTSLAGPLGIFASVRSTIMRLRGFRPVTNDEGAQIWIKEGPEITFAGDDWLVAGISCPFCAAIWVAAGVYLLSGYMWSDAFLLVSSIAGVSMLASKIGVRS